MACSHKFDRLVKPDVEKVPCPECEHPSRRLISAPRLDPKMGLDPDFPTAYDNWGKRKTQKAKTDKEYYKKHGTDKTYGGDVQS